MKGLLQIAPLYTDAAFIKRGAFNPNQLIWWNKRVGYFVTDLYGSGMNGDYRLSTRQVEQTLASI